MIKYSGYTTDGVGGIRTINGYPLWETNQCADGEPVDFNFLKYILSSVTEIDKDFCNYYTDGKHSILERFINSWLMKEIKKTNNEDPVVGLAATLMQPISDEATRIGNKGIQYIQANIAKLLPARMMLMLCSSERKDDQ